MNELPYAGAEGSVIADVLAAIKESDEITDKRILNISARSDGRRDARTIEWWRTTCSAGIDRWFVGN